MSSGSMNDPSVSAPNTSQAYCLQMLQLCFKHCTHSLRTLLSESCTGNKVLSTAFILNIPDFHGLELHLIGLGARTDSILFCSADMSLFLVGMCMHTNQCNSKGSSLQRYFGFISFLTSQLQKQCSF